YFRRRGYLFTSWNVFLAGTGNFVGISAFQSGVAEEHIYGSFDSSDYTRFMLGATVFLLTGVLTYRLFSLPAQIGRLRLQKWLLPTRTALLTTGLLAAMFT